MRDAHSLRMRTTTNMTMGCYDADDDDADADADADDNYNEDLATVLRWMAVSAGSVLSSTALSLSHSSSVYLSLFLAAS